MKPGLFFSALLVAVFGALPIAAQSASLCPVFEAKQWGLIDSTGRVVVSPRFEAVTVPENADIRLDQAFWAKSAGAWGLYDPAGTWLLKPTMQEERGSWQGKAFLAMASEGLYKLFDGKGKQILTLNFPSSLYLKDGFLTYGNDGFLSLEGNPLRESARDSENTFDIPFIITQDLIPVSIKGHWGYRKRNGTFAIPPLFQEAGFFRGGYAAARYKGKWGFLAPDGSWAVSPRFEAVSLECFSQGLAPAKDGGLWGYIDTTGSWIIKPQWMQAQNFSMDRAPVAVKVGAVDNNNSYRWGAIDLKGKLVIPTRYNFLTPFRFNHTVIQNSVSSGDYVPLDLNGKEFLPAGWYPKYTGQRYWVLVRDENHRIHGLFDMETRTMLFTVADAEDMMEPKAGLVLVLFSWKRNPGESYHYGYLNLEGKTVYDRKEPGRPFLY